MVLFISFPTHLCSSLVMDRQSTSSPVYNHDDEFDAMKNVIDAKMDKHMEELKVLIKNGKRSSSSSKRCSSAKTSVLPSPASTHKHRHRQDHEEQPTGRELASLPPPCTRALDPRAHGLQHPRAHGLYRAATSTPRLRLLQHLWHLRQVTSRHLRLRTYDIFAYSTSSSPLLPRATMTLTPTTRFLSMGL